MKFLGFNKVLCLAPHPDDVEYSMGGTIIKHYNTQFDILCLTQGGDCDVTTGNSRLDEVRNSWESTGITNINLYFSPYKLLKEKGEDEWVNYIETNFVNKNNYEHRSYFKEDTIKGFHTNFQCSKKGTKLVEQFNLKQLFI